MCAGLPLASIALAALCRKEIEEYPLATIKRHVVGLGLLDQDAGEGILLAPNLDMDRHAAQRSRL